MSFTVVATVPKVSADLFTKEELSNIWDADIQLGGIGISIKTRGKAHFIVYLLAAIHCALHVASHLICTTSL